MRKDKVQVRIRVSFDVEIAVPADWDDEQIRFYVEENGCPGTGSVGSAVSEIVEKLHAEAKKSDEEHYCWACGWDDRGVGNGESKVLEIRRTP